MLVAAIPTAAQGPALLVPDEVAQGINAQKSAAGVYIIEMIDSPAIAYEGEIEGLPATKPAKGVKLNPNNPKVQKYVSHLKARHDSVLGAVGAADKKIYDYTVTFNGFSAVLTGYQAAMLAQQPGVVRVWEDELRRATTDNSPGFLGLSDPGGLWDMGYKGEDVIIGVIDTGIWPEHPSFSDQEDLADRSGRSGKRTLVYGPPPADWYGTCQSGELWSQDDCNNKLIGARYFLDGYGHQGIITGDYKSPRDANGHGSHTASTAGGNAGVTATLLGVDRGVVTGMAPRARIAMYKGLWNDGSGYTSDLVAAIDAAVADGVDVINYSIGGSGTSVVTPDAVAFLFAADAGVFVATSAGNSGPGAFSLGNPAVAPWLTTVGANTQDRTFEGKVVLGDASEYTGASITGGTAVLPLVDAVDAGSELCIPGELDPSAVAGKIVLCKRGVIARVDKSLAVYMAGGAGMVQYNTNDLQSLNTDNHWLPSVHVNYTKGAAIKAYIAAQGAAATAQIYGGAFTPIPAPWMADFSSRGPNPGVMDLVKPDITAPGVNILAANTPTALSGAPGQLFQSIGGTSMSSPHIAGIFALVKEAHPDWSPAMAKSALMTTADTNVLLEDGLTPAGPFEMGAGMVQPNPAVDPGLVYDAGFFDYLAFLCGSTSAVGPGTCALLESWGFSFDPSELNLPSIGVADLAGSQVVHRTVANVGPAGTYTAFVEAPVGVSVAVDPAVLDLDAGETTTFSVTFTTLPDAVIEAWTFGALTWSDGAHNVRSPLAIRPVALSAPLEVMGSGAAGSLDFDITFGYAGAYSAAAHGLVPATMTPGYVVDDPANDINVALSTGVGITVHMVSVPAGALHARFSLFDAYTDGNDDLDLYVFDPDGNYVGGSGSGTSAEQVDVAMPMEGDYTVIVHGWGTDGPDANYTLFSWLVGADMGNMTVVAPAAATLGATETVTVNWTGLDAGAKYLGAVSHDDGGGVIGVTLVNISTESP